MADQNASDSVDELADGVSKAGRKAGDGARRAGERLADTVEDVSDRAERAVRRAGRRGERAFEDAADEFEVRSESLEAAIRRNPLGAAAGALFVGFVLGRFLA